MAELDDYVRSIVVPNLIPGEAIKGIGGALHFSKHTALDIVSQHAKVTPYLIAATDRRLILIKTSSKMTWNALNLNATNLGIEVWFYSDLSGVRHKSGPIAMGAQQLNLLPHEGRGPLQGGARRIYIKRSVQRMDAPERLASPFPSWLKENVDAQLFTPEGLPPEVIERRAREAELRHEHSARQAARPKKPRRSKFPVVLGAMGVGAMAFGHLMNGKPDGLSPGTWFCTFLSLAMLAAAIALFITKRKKYTAQVAEHGQRMAQFRAQYPWA